MKGIKYTAMAAALGVVSAALQRTSDVYGTMNSQDADYRALQQQIGEALALPDDPDVDAPPPQVVLTAMTPDQVDALVERVVAAIPAATDPAAIVTAITAEIERSDVSVIDAIAQTRADIITAVTPAAPTEEPAAE